MVRGIEHHGIRPLPERARRRYASTDGTRHFWDARYVSSYFDASPKAFGFPARNMQDEEHRSAFFVGHSFFNNNWVVAPGATAGRDGLGPLFNTRSCSACHADDGRSRPPEPGQPMTSMFLRLSIPGSGPHRAPLPKGGAGSPPHPLPG